MAGKGKTEKRAAWEVDFLHVELDKAQREALQKWDVSGEQSFVALERLLIDGHKLSFTFDKGNDCVIAAATSPKTGDGNRQWCLTARGPDFSGGMRALAYKFIVILDGDPSSARTVAENRSSWG